MLGQLKKCRCRSAFCDYDGETLVEISCGSSILDSSPSDRRRARRENPKMTIAQFTDIPQRPDRYTVADVQAALRFSSEREGTDPAAWTRTCRDHLHPRPRRLAFISPAAARTRVTPARSPRT